MFRYIFQGSDDLTIYPVIALVIFFTFFVALIWWLARLDRQEVRYMEELPLDNPTILNHGGPQHG